MGYCTKYQKWRQFTREVSFPKICMFTSSCLHLSTASCIIICPDPPRTNIHTNSLRQNYNTMSSNSPKRERLDVESPQDREARLGIVSQCVFGPTYLSRIPAGQLLQSISSNQNQSQESTPIKSLNPLPSRPHVVPESDGKLICFTLLAARRSCD